MKLITSVSQHGVETPEKQYQAHQVSCGASHTVAVSMDGNVWVWGSGAQLGLGETRKCLTPTVLPVFQNKDVLKVHCGDYHSVVLVEQSDRASGRRKSDTKQSREDLAAKDSPKVSRVKVSREQLSLCAEGNKLLGFDSDERLGDDSITHGEHVFEDGDRANVCLPKVARGNKTETVIAANIVEDYYGEKNEIKADTHVSNVGNRTSDADEDTSEKTGVVMKESEKVQNEDTGRKSLASEAETETEETETEVKDHVSTTAVKEVDVEPVVTNVNELISENAESNTEIKDTASLDAESSSEVQIRPKVPDQINIELKESGEDFEDPLGLRSTASLSSNVSSKSRTKSFLNEAETREFLAKQFDDDSCVFIKGNVKQPTDFSPHKTEAPVSPGYSLKQGIDTVTSLTSHMTSQMSSFTSKAFGNITSVFLMSDEVENTDKIKTKEEKFEKDSERSDSPGLDDSTLDLSALGDITTNVSLMSLQDTDTSQGEATPESSPWKKKGEAVQETTEKKQKVAPSSPVSVSKQSQSIRTIEAKQEQLRKRSLNLPTAGKPPFSLLQ